LRALTRGGGSRSIHIWPESWLRCGGGDGAACASFAAAWVRSHAAAAARLRKPLLVAEFGLANAGARAAFFRAVYACVEDALDANDAHNSTCLDAAAAGGEAAAASALAGSCFWMLAHAGYPNADGTLVTVAHGSSAEDDDEDDSGCANAAVLADVARHAAAVRAWNGGAGGAAEGQQRAL
jgi:hypothetical protein